MASTYQVELDDTSPIISYAPSGDPLATNADLRKGWSPAFSNISLIALGQQGSGSTSHVTSCDGAIMTIRWIGTSIQLFGSVSSADYTILLDGSLQLGFTSSRDTNMLASINKLSNANHTISLVAHVNSTGGLVAFDKAILTVSAEVANATISSRVIDDDSLLLKGKWDFETLPAAAAGEPAPSFHISQSFGDEATLPFNGSAITVLGFRNITAGQYNVTLDDITTSYNGQSSFAEPATLFLATGLDPSSPHKLTITNVDNRTLAVGSINVTSISGGLSVVGALSSRSIPKRTIIGISVAAAAAFVIIVSLIAYFLWRRRSDQVRRRCNIMNLRVSTRRNNRRHHRDESTDFVDIRAGAEVRSDEGHLNMKESMFSGPKSQSLSYSFDVPTPLPRPIGEYTPSPPGQSDRRYSDVLDISPQSGGITQVHARDSSRGALLADYGNNERIGRRIVDVPHSPSPSRRSEDYPTSASGTDPEENLFTASRRPSAHVYATARPIESPIEEEAHYLSVENVSPLEVDFSNIGQSEADHQNRPPSVQPQTIQLPQLTVQSATPRSGSNIREPITSFLDLSSTASSSQKHTSSSDQSVYSSFYATEAGPSRPISSSNQFRPASLSISVDNSRRGTLANPVPPSPHRFRAADIDSPTDSVPVSVSEIQFRHSEDADSDVVSSYRPPHPPLSPSSGPGRMAFVTPPLIAQKLLGREPGIGTSTSFTMPRPAGPRSPSYPSSSRNPSEQRSQW